VARTIRSCLAALLLATAVVPGSAVASVNGLEVPARAPIRALILLQPGMDDVLARIRGQTSDLRVELSVEPVDTIPGDLGAQVRMAHALTRQRNAMLVIWFVRSASTQPHFVVVIALPAQSRLWTRDLGPSNAASGSTAIASAVKEGAALVVRAAIQAVLGGSRFGDEEERWLLDHASAPLAAKDDVSEASSDLGTRAEATQTPVPSSEGAAPARGEADAPTGPMSTPPTTTPVQTSTLPASPVGHDWPWAVGVDWLSRYDGATGKALAECASVRAERSAQRFSAFVSVSHCLNREIDAGGYGRFRIARQQAALGARVSLLRSWFEASLGAKLGVVAYERTTVPAPGAASPKTHVMGTAGPEFRLVVPARDVRIQGSFALGLDFVMRSTRIGYRDPAVSTPDHFVPITQLSVVQPYLALGLAFRW